MFVLKDGKIDCWVDGEELGILIIEVVEFEGFDVDFVF